jgi:hypothetical protein
MNPLRRNFFKGFGVLGAVVAGATAVKVTVEEVKKPTEDHSHLEPTNNTNIQFVADNSEKKVKPAGITPDGKLFYFAESNPPIEEQNKVTLSVGKDDRLWMKVGEKWHRVSIDS